MIALAPQPVAARAPYASLGVSGLLLGFLTLLVVQVGGVPTGLDDMVHTWAVARRPGWVAEGARIWTDTGVGLPAGVLAMLAGAVLTGAVSVWERLGGALLALGVLVAGAVVRRGCAELVGRERPPDHDWSVHATGHAFPSGHTTAATIVAVLLVTAFTRAWMRVLIVAWAIGVGLTRIWLGVHWPTDVLGGWCFGLLWGGAALWLLRRRA
ncbi:phosphatase PAP2 family protein [Actinocorallia sp. API 0066]|uniref:phosphatase PAP2 family protein n=1 Tax=Actinocorallia sp. API 0066 TaxID=2896846 RepID=UPI001E595825|nr:phosphatase PAP2 family protein [Actinocorallia sp. API 0066]MCD0453001.1 phosphatase PAP2 family protein [Actinocorallia sp. API 0066]